MAESMCLTSLELARAIAAAVRVADHHSVSPDARSVAVLDTLDAHGAWFCRAPVNRGTGAVVLDLLTLIERPQ